jgi:hypothetical protein
METRTALDGHGPIVLPGAGRLPRGFARGLRGRLPRGHCARTGSGGWRAGLEIAPRGGRLRTLPIWLDLDGLRGVHACWDESAIASIAAGLKQHRGVTTAFLEAACRKGAPLFAPVDITLKGKEAKLPPPASFTDKDGHVRNEIRTGWYSPPEGHTYGTHALQSDEIVCPVPLEQAVIDAAAPYPADAKPVFVGHYSLTAPRPELLAENVACLDYSVAKGGLLCAYRWDGERKLRNDRFVWVAAVS